MVEKLYQRLYYVFNILPEGVLSGNQCDYFLRKFPFTLADTFLFFSSPFCNIIYYSYNINAALGLQQGILIITLQ